MQTSLDASEQVTSFSTVPTHTIALLPWGHAWEDFHDSIGLSFESFCNQTTGGWQFGYIDALRLAGVRTIIIYPSTRINELSQFTHIPTGCTIYMLPIPKSYQAIRQQMVSPYPSFGGGWQAIFGDAQGGRRLLLKALNEVAPYLATPIGLLTQVLRREECSAILCQEYEYFRFDLCVLLGQALKIPVYATFQGTTGRNDGIRIGNALRRFTTRACAGLIIGPQTEIERVKTCYKLSPKKIQQIFNPLDLRMWSLVNRNEARAKFHLSSSALVVVWHGRVEMQIKGLDILLDAWEQICCDRPEQDLRLLMMGTGRDVDKLKERISALPNQNVLWINEYINDRQLIRDFLATGDVYAFPSRVEGFPVAPVEAMACGLPLVAAAAPGISDILEEGEASGGIIVPKDNVGVFTAALGRVLDDEAFRQELGKRAKQRVEKNFSLEVVGRQLRNFILKSNPISVDEYDQVNLTNEAKNNIT